MEYKNKILEPTMTQIRLLIILIFFIAIAACSASDETKKSTNETQQVITITKSKPTSTLYFDGIIAPIQINVVASPIDGTVEKMYFSYGEQVNKGKLLLKLKSATLGKNYQQAISTYLTAKEKFNTSKSNIVGAKDLYDSGITSKQTYEAAQSDLNDSYLSFLQAQLALIELLRNAGITQHDLYLLQINDTNAVRKTLQTPLKAINIYASMNGIALKPIKSADSSSSDNSNQPIHVGSVLKEGQVIASIGEMSGIKISINVDEIRINQLKVGDSATVTSAAFPGINLSGEIVAVSSQANSNTDSGGLPTFPVVVAVKNITTQEQQVIHVGMSAKVQINSISPAEIVIPIQAVKSKQNITYVNLINPVSGKTVQQLVQVGQTTVDGVTIINGLKPGDKIVISH